MAHSCIAEQGFQKLTQQPLAGISVLIMEDEFLIAMDIEQLCRDQGARECMIARTLEEAASASGFDIAIVDLKLGGDSTLDYARSLRSRGIPFVFATGYSDQEQLRTEFAEIAVIEKPYSGPDLVEALAAALQRPTQSTGSG